MQENKYYSLKLNIKSILSKNLPNNSQYVLKITKQNVVKILGPFKISQNGQIPINKKEQFKIPNGQLTRDSKCTIQIYEQNSKQLVKQQGKYEFLIMDYKNYAKKSCKLMSGDKIIGIMQINFNISSSQQGHKNNSEISESRKFTPNKSIKLQEEPMAISKAEPLIRIKAPLQQIKLICPVQPTSQKGSRGMFNAFQHSGIVIQTKKEIGVEQKKAEKNIISSMGQIFEKRNKQNEEMTLKVPTNEGLHKSMRSSLNRSQNNSRYCKQIQLNLDNLSALDEQANRLSFSRSPLKQSAAQFSIFDTLNRMKVKFQNIHRKQEILNDDNSQMMEEQNDICSDRELDSPLYSHIHQLKSINQNLTVHHNDLGKSTLLNLQVNSQVAFSRKLLDDYRIMKTVDFYYEPIRSSLKISHCFDLKFASSKQGQKMQQGRDLSHKKRYMLAKMKNVSQFNGQNTETDYKAYLSHSIRNIQIQEESLKKSSYIKLNKISHLTQAADSLKKRNLFLIKANQQLTVGKRLAQQKLQISKKILDEKEDILDHEFQNLTSQMKKISQNLNFKNKQSIEREQKIKSLKILIQTYVRDINQLKEDLKKSYSTIKDLKSLIANKEEAQSLPSKRQDLDQVIKQANNLKDLLRKAPNKQFQTQRRGNYTSNCVSNVTTGDKKIRKYGSVDNTISFEQNDEKSTNKAFRKFSHSKNISNFEPQFNRLKPNNMDLVFQQLNGLFSGDSGARILKNL